MTIARTIREAEIIKGILTNAEDWNDIKQADIDELEMVDWILLRRILGAPESACSHYKLKSGVGNN